MASSSLDTKASVVDVPLDLLRKVIGEKVRPDYTHPVPGLDNLIESPEGVPAIGILELLTMKLQSFRDRDRTHIRDMLEVKLLTQGMIDQLPPDLRGRMDQILATPET